MLYIGDTRGNDEDDDKDDDDKHTHTHTHTPTSILNDQPVHEIHTQTNEYIYTSTQ